MGRIVEKNWGFLSFEAFPFEPSCRLEVFQSESDLKIFLSNSSAGTGGWFCGLQGRIFCENLLVQKGGRYARCAGGCLSELSLAQVDLEEVLHRLALHARHLVAAAWCLGIEDLVWPGGDSPADLASATLLKFLDPLDPSVMWSESKGPPTTAGLLAFLRVVLQRDFLNLVRSKRYRDTIYPDRNKEDVEPQGIEGDWFDSLPANSPGPEHEAISHKVTAWLLEQFREEPDLEAILRLQLEMDGYNGFTNLELARMLTVPVVEIENRKRRLKTRLNNLASSRQIRRTKHG